jgi:RHS repeat-associated protein
MEKIFRMNCMKKLKVNYLFICCLLSASYLGAQTTTENYISSRTVKVKTTNAAAVNTLSYNDVILSVDYFDGFGRITQSIASKATPAANKDLVTVHQYNLQWQEEKNYLPYADANVLGGGIKSNALAAQSAFYNSGATTIAQDAFPFSTKVFDGSALNRVLELSNPGAAWQIGTGHTTKMNYENNAAGDCLFWTLTGNNTGASATISYAANTLFKMKNTDADGKVKYDYKDLNGNTLLMRQQKDAVIVNEASSFTEVYYVYDNYNNLTYVIPPMAMQTMKASASYTFTETSPLFLEQMYAYHYDYRNRITEKKVPGKDWEYIVYNKLDQPVLMQNAHLRALGKWQFTKYDGNGRAIISGLYTSPSNRDQLQTLANTQTIFFENKDAAATANFYYSNVAMPNTNTEILTVTYFDDYSFNLQSKAFVPFGAYTAANTVRTQGLATGAYTKVLGSSPAQYLGSVIYYDEYNRPIQNYKEQYCNGAAWDRIDNTYNFAGELTQSLRYHTGPQNLTIQYRYEYDHMGRKTKTYFKANTDAEVVHSDLKYNDIGQLIEKNIHGIGTAPSYTYLQSIDYRYNIQGWLSSINNAKLDNLGGNNDDLNDAFGMEMYYQNPPSNLTMNGTTAVDAQYSGNISATIWKSKDMNASAAKVARQSYAYKYDVLDRLTKSRYSTEVTPNNNVYSKDADRFNETLTYDVIGNILTLQRNGRNNVLVDNLTYDYNNSTIATNKLFKINDAGINDANFNDFKDLTVGAANKYVYDAEGRLTNDLTKKVSYAYNHLSLPTIITNTVDASTLNFIYDATGRKIARSIPSSTTIHYYMDGIESEFTPTASAAAASVSSPLLLSASSTTSSAAAAPSASSGSYAILFAATEEGRIRPKTAAANTYFFDYFLKDHLGNIRVSLTDELPIVTYPVASVEDKVGTTNYANNIVSNRLYYSIPPSRVVLIPGSSTAFGYNNPALSTPPTAAQLAAINKKCVQLYHTTTNDSLKTWVPKILKVNSGDKISATVNAFYSGAITTTSVLGNGFFSNFINTMVSNVPSGIPTSDIIAKLQGNFSNTSNAYNSAVNSIYNSTYNSTSGFPTGVKPITKPKAYLLLLFYDQDFNLLKDQSYIREVQSNPGVQDIMTLTDKVANVAGYCQIAVVNEYASAVFFDKFNLIHKQSNTSEINEFYSYGLQNLQMSSTQFGSKPQNYKYNGKELFKDFKLEAEDYGARLYSPQIGKWSVIDPMANIYESNSSYSYCLNNPIMNTDPDGRTVKGSGVFEDYIGDNTDISNQSFHLTNNVNVDTKTKRVTVTETNDPVDYVWLDGVLIKNTDGTPRAYAKDTWGESAFKAGGFSIWRPEATGMGATDFALTTVYGAKLWSWGAGLMSSLFTNTAVRGIAVIGPRATYREFAKSIGAKFLNVTDDAWTWAKNEGFLADVVKSGDDVIFSGKFNPLKLDPNSVLAKEVKYLIERGYKWTSDFSKLIKN